MRPRINRLGIAATLAMMASLASAQSGISVTVNGQPLQFSGTGPQMVNGRVLVPLRGIFERLGATVRWNSANQEVTATRGNDTVDLRIGDPNASVNGRSVTLDVPAEVVNGSTLVPIRFVSESVGAKVLWHESEQNVEIQADALAPTGGDDQGPSDENAGPVRMARVSMIDGGVTWRPGDDVDWADAADNLPLRQGAQIWLNPGGRTEIQFDDGSMLRLGDGAVATLQTMFSDDKGEFTEIRLNSGTASLKLTNSLSTYQIDTPLASATSTGYSRFRVDANNGLRVVVRSGQAQIQGDAGQTTINRGQYLSLAGPTSSYRLASAPGEDSWDQYCDRRDGVFEHPSPYLPSSIAVVAGDLGSYGSWESVPGNGNCWRPRVASDWAPYRDGHWVWVSPFGWTWCGNEPWGWAPYHYGTWLNSGGAWYWRPGPAQQYWSPAVVHFSTYNGAVAWAPLAPSEVRYPPTLSVGFRSGNWAVHFSIGAAAAYYPTGSSYCAPRPWQNREVNHTTTIYNVTKITNIQNTYVTNNFVPRNSRVAGGATSVSTSGFGTGGRFARVTNAAVFTQGKSFAPPTSGRQFAGPTNVRPTAAAFAPTHQTTMARPSEAILNKPVVRTAIPTRAAAVAVPMPNVKTLPRTLPVVGTTPVIPSRPSPPRTNPIPRNPGPIGNRPQPGNPRLNPRGNPPVNTNPRINPRLNPPTNPTPRTNPRLNPQTKPPANLPPVNNPRGNPRLNPPTNPNPPINPRTNPRLNPPTNPNPRINPPTGNPGSNNPRTVNPPPRQAPPPRGMGNPSGNNRPAVNPRNKPPVQPKKPDNSKKKGDNQDKKGGGG